MNFDKLDGEELLRAAVDAMNNNRAADAMVMLKALLERDGSHVYARYLLAAQHAQLGMLDRAEMAFRDVVDDAPGLAIARFQLGQLLVTKGETDDAVEVLSPLAAQQNALGAYARAISAAAVGELSKAITELEQGLALAQEIPVLASDMERLKRRLGEEAEGNGKPSAVSGGSSPATSMFLTGYGRG